MKGIKKISLSVCVALAILILTNLTYAKSKPEQDIIKFGFIGPLTGQAASYGDAQKRGIQIAVEEINSSGGINGRNIKVVFEDDQMDPNKALSAIKKLIDIDKVTAIIGETTTAGTLAIAGTANKRKIVLLSPSASGEKVTDAGDYVFRVAPSDSFQAIVAAEFIHHKGFKKGTIVYTNDDWGNGLKKAFEKSLGRLGGEILLAEGCTPGTQDFRTILVKIMDIRPEFIYIPLYLDESATFLRQVKELKVNSQILGADNFSDKALLTTAGSTADGVIFTMPAEPHNEEYSSYLAKYMAKYNENGNYTSASAYDCVYLLTDSVRKSSLNGEQIKNALYNVKNYKGASGLISFDNNGDVTTKVFSVIKIEDGQYKTITD